MTTKMMIITDRPTGAIDCKRRACQTAAGTRRLTHIIRTCYLTVALQLQRRGHGRPEVGGAFGDVAAAVA
jgi:hypothetical protein